MARAFGIVFFSVLVVVQELLDLGLERFRLLGKLGRRRGVNESKKKGQAVDWILGVIAVIAFVIATATMWRMGNAEAQLTKKVDVSLRTALGALKADADENAALFKK